MRNDAIRDFKQLLTRHRLEKEFKQLVNERGLNTEQYLIRVQAIFAVRVLVDKYDKSEWAKFAVEWEDKVILNGYSSTMQEYVAQHGMQVVIKAIHILQEQGKWVIPSFHKVINRNSYKAMLNQGVNTDTTEMVKKEPVAPKPEPKKKTIVITEDKTKKPMKKNEQPKLAFTPIENDDTYEVISFGKASHRYNTKWTAENLLRIIHKGNDNYITFNDHISNVCSTFPDVFVYVRRDKLTTDLYLVFTKEEMPGSLHCRYKGNSLLVTSKPLIEYIALYYICNEETSYLKISENRSRTDDCVTIKILGKNDSCK